MKLFKPFLIVFAAASIFFGAQSFAQTASNVLDFDIKSPKPEIHIDQTGKVSILGAKIIQFAGSTIYTRVIWDNSYIRLLVKTNAATTKIARKYGETIRVANMAVGDYLSIDGVLESGADSLSVISSNIVDLSDQTQQNNFSGTVSAIDSSLTSFTMNSDAFGAIKVALNSSTQITLGSRTIDANHLKVGNKISSVSGTYNYADKSLAAQKIVVYIDMNIFKPKNFSGVLKTAPGKTLPTTMTVTIGSADYLVNLPAGTQVINNKRKTTSLSRFLEGDKVFLYGHLRESDEPIIDDVEIVRDANL